MAVKAPFARTSILHQPQPERALDLPSNKQYPTSREVVVVVVVVVVE